MSAIVSTVANIRTISIFGGIIAVIIFIWYISESLKNPLKGLFGSLDGNSEQSAQDVVRNEIDQSEQSIKDETLTQKNQIITQTDKNRDILLEKTQDVTEQVKRVIEKENEEGEERLLNELDQIEARILQNLDDSRTTEGDLEKWNRLLTYYNIYVNAGSSTTTAKDDRALESWQYEELIESLQSGIVYVGKNGGLVRNF